MVHKGAKKKDAAALGKFIEEHQHKHDRKSHVTLKVTITAVVTMLLASGIFHYMDTKVPEGVNEVWSARILDTALRTNGKVILSLHKFGIHGGVTWWTRKMVDVVLTTMITGSPFGLGPDPDLKPDDGQGKNWCAKCQACKSINLHTQLSFQLIRECKERQLCGRLEGIYDTLFDGVAVRVYEPINYLSKDRPVLVYYHGGGWSWLSVDVYDQAMRELAKRVPMVVVSVAYRQSPEHAHPIPFEDCLKATEYVINNAAKLGIDKTRVAISGDSAGGHLTAAVSLRLKKKIRLQIPIYPCLQMFDMMTPSYLENKEFIPGMLNDVSMLTYWLNYGNISYDHIDDILANKHTSPRLKKSKYAGYVGKQWYMKEHIRTQALYDSPKRDDFGDVELSKSIEKTILDPYFSPLMVDEKELADLPQTYVLTAGHDVLRDDGLIYYQRLKKAGVRVHLAHYPEGFHGMIFFFKGPMPFKVGISAMNDLSDYLNKIL